MNQIVESKKFRRKTENFICINCGYEVKGNGYTNHCPQCLYSLHVDINPGDRASSCHGIMKPVGIEIKKSNYVIIHRCQKCGHEKKNKSSPDDDIGAISKVSSEHTTRYAN